MIQSKILKISLFLFLFPFLLKSQELDYTHVIFRVNKVDFTSHHPNFNPFSLSNDNLCFNGCNIRAPRIVFHLGYPLLNNGINYGLEKIGVSVGIRKKIVMFGLPLTPHLIQAYRGLRGGYRYQLNTYDWIYDFFDKQPIYFDKSSIISHSINSTIFSGFARP